MSANVVLSDLDLEAQLIGAAMRAPRVARACIDLSDQDFVDPVHQRIWRIVRALAKDDRPATPSAIATEVGTAIDKMGGIDFLSALYLAGEQLGPAAPRAADRLRQMSLWRNLAQLPGIVTEAMTGEGASPEEVASRLIRHVQGALSQNANELRMKSDVARRAIETALAPSRAQPTLIYELDLIMQGGLHPTRLYGIGGLYGRGKTILAGTISENLNIQSVPHLFITYETPPEDIETRNIARAMEINSSAIYDSEAEQNKIFRANANKYLAQMKDTTVFVHKPGATMDEIERIIIKALHKHDIRGFILDYWQLIRGKERGQSESEHLQLCADRLAEICRREDIWGVLTAQIDENGNPANCPAGLRRACSLYVSLRRDANGAEAQFVTEKSNYTRLANIGSDEEGPSVVFDMAGPHFRSAD